VLLYIFSNYLALKLLTIHNYYLKLCMTRKINKKKRERERKRQRKKHLIKILTKFIKIDIFFNKAIFFCIDRTYIKNSLFIFRGEIKSHIYFYILFDSCQIDEAYFVSEQLYDYLFMRLIKENFRSILQVYWLLLFYWKIFPCSFNASCKNCYYYVFSILTSQ